MPVAGWVLTSISGVPNPSGPHWWDRQGRERGVNCELAFHPDSLPSEGWFVRGVNVCYPGCFQYGAC